MKHRTEQIVDTILESYGKYDLTSRIDAENRLNKAIIIEVLERIRRVLFPGFFDDGNT